MFVCLFCMANSLTTLGLPFFCLHFEFPIPLLGTRTSKPDDCSVTIVAALCSSGGEEGDFSGPHYWIWMQLGFQHASSAPLFCDSVKLAVLNQPPARKINPHRGEQLKEKMLHLLRAFFLSFFLAAPSVETNVRKTVFQRNKKAFVPK